MGVVRKAAFRLLSEAGYRVFEAGVRDRGAGGARHLAAADRPGLVDVVMPDVSGVALARLIREEWPAVRILFMSAYPAEILVREGLDHPSVFFLAKPFTRAELMEKIVAALRGHPARRQAVPHLPALELTSGLCLRMPPDAVVVGSGPNGLAAAIVLAQAGSKRSCVKRSRRWAAAFAPRS